MLFVHSVLYFILSKNLNVPSSLPRGTTLRERRDPAVVRDTLRLLRGTPENIERDSFASSANEGTNN